MSFRFASRAVFAAVACVAVLAAHAQAQTADLSITKDDGMLNAVPGTAISYTIVVANDGPNDVTAASVTDSFPSELTGVTWSCTAVLGACTAAGSGDINDIVDIQATGTLTYTVNATVDPSATGSLSNTATVTEPMGVTDPGPGLNSATDVDSLDPTADLSISKTDGVLSATPGDPLTYTITVSNAGPSDAPGTTVSDAFPAELTGVSWTCTPSLGATCSLAGAGDINDVVDIPAGGSLVYIVNATIDPAATGILSNTAAVTESGSVTDPGPGANSDTDNDVLTPMADLAITKTDGSPTAIPGTAISYTITVTNNGPSDAPGTTVSDSFPVQLSGVTWSCTPTVGSTCGSGMGDISDLVTVLAGGTLTYTVNASIDPSATGTLSNTATVTPDVSVSDPGPSANSDTDNDTLIPTADLGITKTDGAASEIPGTSISYTISVTNSGPSDAPNTLVSDTFPAQLNNVMWSCVASGGSTCTASGMGNIGDTVLLLAGGTLTYTVTADISPAAVGTLSNTATVTEDVSITDPGPNPNSATDNDTLVPTADLGIAKTDGAATEIPGTSITYFITVINSGPSDAPGTLVSDMFSADLNSVSWTCVATGGSTCSAMGSGNIADLVTLAAGGTLSYTVTAMIDPGAVGILSNTATVAPAFGVTDPGPNPNSATDNDVLTPQADLSVSKTDGVTTVVAGTGVTYTIVVSNSGPSNAPAANVIDNFSGSLTGVTWVCGGSGGATCTAMGSGDINDTPNLPAGSSVTYIVNATVDPCASGSLSNTATATPGPGVSDANGATDTDTDSIDSQADLVLTVVDVPDPQLVCNYLTYTFTITNNGPSCANNVSLTNVLPSGVSFNSVVPNSPTCDDFGGTQICNLGTLAPAASTNVTITGLVDFSLKGTAIFDTATVASSTTDPGPGVNSVITQTDVKPRDPYVVTITAAPRFLRIGVVTKVDYLIRVTSLCAAGVPTTGVVVTSTLPDGLELLQSSPEPTTQDGNTQTYEYPFFDGDTSETIVMQAQLVDGTPPGTELTHTVSLIDDYGQTGFDSATIGVRALGASAGQLKLRLNAIRRIQAGGLLRTRIGIDNTALTPATNVHLELTSPSEAAFVSAVPAPTSVEDLGGEILMVWDIESIPHKLIIKLNQQIDPETEQGSVLTLSGEVSDDSDRSDTETRDVTIRGQIRPRPTPEP